MKKATVSPSTEVALDIALSDRCLAECIIRGLGQPTTDELICQHYECSQMPSGQGDEI